jgi:hypothetical protein
MTAAGIPEVRACATQNIARVNQETTGKELERDRTEKERRATAARERRKAKADQLAAIKLALKTPIAEIKEVARVKADMDKLPSMSEGIYMKDAPTGKGALVYKSGNKIEQIAAAIGRSEALGSKTIDHETGEAFFADNDRTRIAPEGAGAARDEKPEITGVSRTRKKGFTYHSEERSKRFQVNLTGPEYQNGLSSALRALTDENICKMCQQEFERMEGHFEQVHGDPSEPTHADRWGDIVQRYVRKVERKHAKLEREGRKVGLEVDASRKTKAALEAIKGGYEEVWCGGEREWVKK